MWATDRKAPDILVLRGGRSLDVHLERHRALFDTAEDFVVPNGIIERAPIGTVGPARPPPASLIPDFTPTLSDVLRGCCRGAGRPRHYIDLDDGGIPGGLRVELDLEPHAKLIVA